MSVIDGILRAQHARPMLTKLEFLRAIEARAKSRAEMARVLKLAPPRITEMFKGERDLSFDEAKSLADHYGLDDENRISAAPPLPPEALEPILGALLPLAPTGRLTASATRDLAAALSYGLELLAVRPAKPATPDAIDVAVRGVVAQFRAAAERS